MYNPLISIITVCYNSEKFIESTIKNVLSLEYNNIEYIIIDGGSKDSTLDLISKYRSKLSYFVSEPDKGIYDAMNKGLEKASGDWVCFMNSGDLFYSNMILSRIFNSTISEQINVIYGDVIRLYENRKVYLKAKPLSVLSYRIPFSHQSCFVRTSLMKQIKYNIEYEIAADYDFFYKIYYMLGGNTFMYFPVPISICDATDSLSFRSLYLMSKEYNKISSEHKDLRWYISSLKLRVKKLLGYEKK